jgi:hypothetical protein
MNLNKLLVIVSFTLASLFQASASANTQVYSGSLLGTNESPSVITTGIGFATVTMDLDLFTMRVEASFQDLIGNVTASHIHCCTAVAGSGNVGVATVTPTFTGFPSGVTAGTYDHTFDMSLASSYNAAFITNNGGTVSTALSTLIAGMDAGKSYLNVHTSVFPGGEIRALLAPVPEPTSSALMMAGFMLIGFVARNRKA